MIRQLNFPVVSFFSAQLLNDSSDELLKDVLDAVEFALNENSDCNHDNSDHDSKNSGSDVNSTWDTTSPIVIDDPEESDSLVAAELVGRPNDATENVDIDFIEEYLTYVPTLVKK